LVEMGKEVAEPAPGNGSFVGVPSVDVAGEPSPGGTWIAGSTT